MKSSGEGNSETGLQAKIIDLEIGLSHLQRLCEQLNEVVVEQTRELIELKRESQKMREQIKLLQTHPSLRQPPPPADERPPHY